MPINFSDASGGFNGLIPDNTPVVVQMSVIGGGAGQHGELSRATTGTEMLKCKFTVVSGEHAQKVFYNNFIVDPTKERATAISHGKLKSILDSAFDIDPKDVTSAEARTRRDRDYQDFDGLRFIAVAGIEGEKTENGNTYPPKNVLAGVITNDHPDWGKYGPVAQVQSAPSAAAPANAPVVPPMPVQKPKWAED
ncbi:hypothetical protein [Bradyrhizobium sp. Ai1a-2]|uniref:hypothetical protein n=1 Tax=Bradyrhizobium sp. Ai1a-2 TaxID=196490 RepID=UPI0004192E79|nr:hypothetical protein [Bradyrhizobium sp. Ai1a-2]